MITRRLGNIASCVGFWVLLSIVLCVAFLPPVWLFLTSFKSETELFRVPITILPARITLENYRAVFEKNPFGRFMLNSIIVTSVSTVINVLIASMAAYTLARINIPWKSAIMGAILVFSMLPLMSMIVPLFVLMRRLGWVNTYQGMIGPYVTFQLPLSILILTNFFRQTPRELEEAAMIDGAGLWQVIGRVVIPLAAPGLVSAAILVAIMIWNDFLIAVTLATNMNMRTLSVGIVLYPGEYAFPWGIISAASTLAVVPITLFILFAQKWIIGGLTAGAIKG